MIASTFLVFAAISAGKEWCARQDSNLWPTAPEAITCWASPLNPKGFDEQAPGALNFPAPDPFPAALAQPAPDPPASIALKPAAAPHAHAWLSHLTIGLEVTHAALQAADAYTTERAIGRGLAVEANPLMRSAAVRIGLKAAYVAGATVVVEHVRKRAPVAAFVTMFALDSFYAVVVAHNYHAGSATR